MQLRRQLLNIAYLGRKTPLRAILRQNRESVDRLFLRAGRPPVVVPFDSGQLHGFLRHRDFLDQVAEGYESTSLELFTAALTPGATVIDGGAHLGIFTVTAARRVGPTGKVFAFEPDRYNFQALRQNITRSGFDNVVAVPAAIDEESGDRTFYSSRGTVASSLISKTYVGEGDLTAIPMQTVTIDEVVGDGPIGRLVIKLDVEGVEERALRGARGIIERAESVRVLFEHNPFAMADAHVSSEALVAAFEELGFTVQLVDEATGALVPAAAGELEGRRCNLVADRGIG